MESILLKKFLELKAQEYICPEYFQKLPKFLPLKNSFHILSLKWYLMHPAHIFVSIFSHNIMKECNTSQKIEVLIRGTLLEQCLLCDTKCCVTSAKGIEFPFTWHCLTPVLTSFLAQLQKGHVSNSDLFRFSTSTKEEGFHVKH